MRYPRKVNRAGDMSENDRNVANDVAASSAALYSSTDSKKHIELARTWLVDCEESHPDCGHVFRPPPTRLIYIEPSSNEVPKIRLVETKGHEDEQIMYLAFSHCWGGSQTYRLLGGKGNEKKYESALESIDFSELSKNSQDAIRICQEFGLSFIWIDSICIKQDSAEDWANESVKMGDVYVGAVCTIASTGSSSGDGGCYHERDPESLKPCTIGFSTFDAEASESIYIRRDEVFHFERQVDRAPLNKRGWVLQERLLSRRILHFGAEMMYWECQHRSASEISPRGYIYKKYPDDFEDNYVPKLRNIIFRTDLQRAQKQGRGMIWAGKEGVRTRPPPPTFEPDDPASSHTIWQRRRGFWKDIRKSDARPWKYDARKDQDASEDEDAAEGEDPSGFRAAFQKLQYSLYKREEQLGLNTFSNCWYDIVEPYTRGRLTYESDKLVALSGIVSEVSKSTGYTYLAGLWKEQPLTDLLWFSTEGPSKRLGKESKSIAPTWSWASLEGTVGIDLLPDNSEGGLRIEERLTRIVSVPTPTTETTSPDIAGLEGTLTLSGLTCQVTKVKLDGVVSYIQVKNTNWNAARLFQDISDEDIWTKPELLFCLPILQLERKRRRRKTKEVQGLVLRLRGAESETPRTYERVGFFTTREMNLGSQYMKIFTEGQAETVQIM